MIQTLPITEEQIADLPDIRNILGWLTFTEAVALQMCVHTVSGIPGDIVEIGSYCGKSAVVIGDMLRQGCSGTLYCIDPHVDNVKHFGVDSYAQLLENIEGFKLSEFITVMKAYSYETNWQTDIKMLFIDGNHDFASVQQDLQLFEGCIVKCGVVCFHDCYEEGPQKVVEELVNTKLFQKLIVADSLTVLKKL